MRKSDENYFQKSHDRQIYDTKHDEIVIWLYEKLKSQEWVDENVLKFYKNKPNRWQKLVETLEYGMPHIEFGLIKDSFSSKSFTAGFADLALENKVNFSVLYGGQARVEESDQWFFFEVKSSVNIGETIRQINYYQGPGIRPYGTWFVCAPKFPQSKILIEQGIGFIEYPFA